MGRVSKTICSEDGHVRTGEVTLVQDGKRKTFLCPVKELVLLLPTGPEHAEQQLEQGSWILGRGVSHTRAKPLKELIK